MCEPLFYQFSLSAIFYICVKSVMNMCEPLFLSVLAICYFLYVCKKCYEHVRASF